jgi:hypothetical protein
VNQSEAEAFAQRWIAAWNSHELEPILSRYAEDIEVTSPFVMAVMHGVEATLRGKPAVREYWSRALARYPDLHFVLRAAYPGVNSVVIEYLSVQHLAAAECMFFDNQGMVARVIAHYRSGP